MSAFAPTHPLSIMYVEDDPVTRDLVAQTLPKRFPRWTILTAENGKLGLELYRQHRPDIVITDVNMPVMNGILMAGEIKALNPEVVIIAVTAYSETNYLLHAIEIGISHYVLKPIDYRKLFEAIDKSSAGIRLKKQFSEQSELICELNACLEQRALDYAAVNRDAELVTGSVADEMRRPLSAIKTSSSLLLESAGVRLTDQEQSLVAAVVRETEQMERLMEYLLQFTRLKNCPLVREEINLSRIAADVAGQLQLHDPGRRARFIIAEDVTIKGDGMMLKVVMETLLGNAWRFTVNSPEAIIEFGAENRRGVHTCFVRDNGCGFQTERMRPRFDAEEELDGLGIRLATVQRILKRHGGWIEGSGEVGKGAVFTFVV